MSEKKDPYTLKWEKREEKRKEDVLKKMSLELDRKLPGAKFEGGEYEGYFLLYKEKKLNMNFKSFKALLNATSLIAQMLRIYEVNAKNEEFFYSNSVGEIYLDVEWEIDTKYLSSKGIGEFLSASQQSTYRREMEAKKLVDFLNAVKDIH